MLHLHIFVLVSYLFDKGIFSSDEWCKTYAPSLDEMSTDKKLDWLSCQMLSDIQVWLCRTGVGPIDFRCAHDNRENEDGY